MHSPVIVSLGRAILPILQVHEVAVVGGSFGDVAAALAVPESLGLLDNRITLHAGSCNAAHWLACKPAWAAKGRRAHVLSRQECGSSIGVDDGGGSVDTLLVNGEIVLRRRPLTRVNGLEISRGLPCRSLRVRVGSLPISVQGGREWEDRNASGKFWQSSAEVRHWRKILLHMDMQLEWTGSLQTALILCPIHF